jgi:GDP-mannose 4,6-dehydratase
MRILITGITGMVGSHLVDHLLAAEDDVEIHGLVRWRSPRDNIAHLTDRIRLENGDLRDLNSLVRLMEKARPDWIFHLGAQSYVDQSFAAPADTLATNVIGTTNLLDAVRISRLDPLIHICSSSEVYGDVTPDELPIRETSPMRPASPYAVSKVGEDMIAYQYHLSYGIRTIRTRMFTHTGPRRGDVFAESSFARQIAEIEIGLRSNPVYVGNLESVRTIADVRDTVRAYRSLMLKGMPGEVYNIGGIERMTIGEVLETLKGYATVPIEHVVDPARLRPSDVTLQVPDISKFQAVTGWVPEISASDTLRDLLDYHRVRLGCSAASR